MDIVFGATLALVALAGCGRGHDPRNRAELAERTQPRSLAVNVLADTGRTVSFAAPPPDVNVSLARVARARAGVPDPPLPPAAPDTALPAPQLPREEARLLPPILRRPGSLVAPPRLERATAVELEVRVDALGRVVDVRWAAGDTVAAVVGAAERCAETMEFYPALLAGRAVEVWCRQRFDFTPRH